MKYSKGGYDLTPTLNFNRLKFDRQDESIHQSYMALQSIEEARRQPKFFVMR